MCGGAAKKNCWEVRCCGRELGGSKAFELGVCPASTYIWFDGFHGGRNAGRTCWVITGTMCDSTAHGNFVQKMKKCGKCAFYHSVREEEGDEMIPSMLLFRKFEDH